MSNFHLIGFGAVQGPATQTFTACPSGVCLGAEYVGVDRNAATSGGGAYGIFQFVRGASASTAPAGNFVQIQNGSAVQLAAGNSASNFAIGIVPSALSATNVYGWCQVQGRVDYASHTNTGVTAGVQQYVCAGTAGIVVSNVVAGNRIQGLVVPYNQTATGTAVSYAYDLYRPFIAGLTASL